MKIEEFEAILAEHFVEGDQWESYVASHNLDPEACGIFCGRLAKRALETCGVTEDDDLWNLLGPQFTTTALCAFEAALRLKAMSPTERAEASRS